MKNPRAHHEMMVCLGWCIFALVTCILMRANGKDGWACIQAFYTLWFSAHALWWARRI